LVYINHVKVIAMLSYPSRDRLTLRLTGKLVSV